MIDVFLAGGFFFFINFVIGAIFTFYSNLSLFSCVRKKYYKRWKSHRLISGYPLTANPFKTSKYIFNTQEIEDKNIFELKKRVRFWIFYTLICGVMIVGWPIALSILEELLK